MKKTREVNLILLGGILLVLIAGGILLFVKLRDSAGRRLKPEDSAKNERENEKEDSDGDEPEEWETFDYDSLVYLRANSSGTMLPVSTTYEFRKEDDKWVAVYSKGDFLEDEEEQPLIQFEPSEEDIRKLIRLLRDNGAVRWDGYDRENRNVMDGSYFTFEASFSNGKSIKATGYMSYPRGYSNLVEGIREIFSPYMGEE